MIDPTCTVMPALNGKAGFCDLSSCGKPLTGRRRRWCSTKCANKVARLVRDNHRWSNARKAARRRDNYKCVRCGSDDRIEVNHINPLVGSGYGYGCKHHIAGLETLCHRHHVETTNSQRAQRKLESH